jgi:hypothetical protein
VRIIAMSQQECRELLKRIYRKAGLFAGRLVIICANS